MVQRECFARLALILTPMFVLATTGLGCTTPYEPPIIVHGAAKFPGLVALLEPARTLDVVMVHGMCTHDAAWAKVAIDELSSAIGSSIDSSRERVLEVQAPGPVRIYTRDVHVGRGVIRFSALVWSPLTAPLKKQLAYDLTGKPTDCSTEGTCKPRRAALNGALKDSLLNDCLADALAYQGRSRDTMRGHMVEAITAVMSDSSALSGAAGTTPGPLVLITESLGSKLTFDAIEEMAFGPARSESVRRAGSEAIGRLSIVFMGANQLPILGLADQVHQIERGEAVPAAYAEETLQRILRARANSAELEATPAEVKVRLVAYTDPNDLLSYRLDPSRYNAPGVAVSDVLVSNAPTYFGIFARPDHAHIRYHQNKSVVRLISCGFPKDQRCH